MDLSPKSLSRALPWLAAALAIECVIGVMIVWTRFEIPQHTWMLTYGGQRSTCLQTLVHVPQLIFLLVFAGAVKVMTSGGAERIPCQRLLYGAYAAIAGSALARFIDVDVSTDSPRIWLFFNPLGLILTAVAAPGLWGCALAREEDLSSGRISLATRIHARLTFAAVALLVASEISAVAAVGIVSIVKSSTAVGTVSSFVLTISRGCLLWSAWESWRPADDEIVLRDRARRVRHLMVGVAMGTIWSAIITSFAWGVESHGLGGWYVNGPMLIWHGVAQVTLTLITTILLAVALESPERLSEKNPQVPDFKPPPEAPRDTSPIDVP